MKKSVSDRHMADNEVVFRRRNEHMQRGFSELKRIAKEDGQESFIFQVDVPLSFYCECSDENCQRRIMMRPTQYDSIHEHTDQFAVVCGHEVASIEEVIAKADNYCVVRKTVKPDQFAAKLRHTDISNT